MLTLTRGEARRWQPPRGVVRLTFAVLLLVSMLLGLRWLSIALWRFGDAQPLAANSTPLASASAGPIEQRVLDGGLVLSKFEYSVHGTRLNVIHRADDAGPRPTLIMVNGGAWMVEDEDRDLWYAEGWARHGFTVVTITHRTSEVVAFPGPAEDILAGVGFALGLGDSYGIDADRLAFFGGSSGAHLATYTAYRLAETHPDVDVRAVVSVFGPTDFRHIADDARGNNWYRIATLFYAPTVDATHDVNQFLGCNLLSRSCRDQIVAASPITYVGPETAPTMIVQGQQDQTVPWQQATRLADALIEHGRTVELLLDPDMGHALDPDHLAPITSFLDRHLGS